MSHSPALLQHDQRQGLVPLPVVRGGLSSLIYERKRKCRTSEARPEEILKVTFRLSEGGLSALFLLSPAAMLKEARPV